MGDFRELTVWKHAHALALHIHRLTKNFPSCEKYGLTPQLRRASVSAVSNIAEGSGRLNDRELTYFLRIARGSVHEMQCQLLLALDLGYVEKQAWTDIDREVQEVSKMLSRFIGRLARS